MNNFNKSVAIATTWVTLDCNVFQMMHYIIIPSVRMFHRPTVNRFSTAGPRQKPVGGVGGGGQCVQQPRLLWIVKYLK